MLPMQMRGVGCGLNSDWVANEKSITVVCSVLLALSLAGCGWWAPGKGKAPIIGKGKAPAPVVTKG